MKVNFHPERSRIRWDHASAGHSGWLVLHSMASPEFEDIKDHVPLDGLYNSALVI